MGSVCIKAEAAGNDFHIGERVTWVYSDADLPNGSSGRIIAWPESSSSDEDSEDEGQDTATKNNRKEKQSEARAGENQLAVSKQAGFVNKDPADVAHSERSENKLQLKLGKLQQPAVPKRGELRVSFERNNEATGVTEEKVFRLKVRQLKKDNTADSLYSTRSSGRTPRGVSNLLDKADAVHEAERRAEQWRQPFNRNAWLNGKVVSWVDLAREENPVATYSIHLARAMRDDWARWQIKHGYPEWEAMTEVAKAAHAAQLFNYDAEADKLGKEQRKIVQLQKPQRQVSHHLISREWKGTQDAPRE